MPHLPSSPEKSKIIHLDGLQPVFIPASDEDTIIIAGPCSAESRHQTLAVAQELRDNGIRYFRAGAWKPRTMPGGFEGRGKKALPWLADVKKTLGMDVATEVANSEHVRCCLEKGIRTLWIGARTSANPFAVQEIADTIAKYIFHPGGDKPACDGYDGNVCDSHHRESDIKILVKNPVNPDLELWIGAICRIYNAGVRHIAAVHRGFSSYGLETYRNTPFWHIPIELKRRLPGLQLICDPSHIGGRRDLIAPLAQEALDLGFDGVMIESHTTPDEALSDSAQQITPKELSRIATSLVTRRNTAPSANLTRLRGLIDNLDDQLIEILGRRMEISREIGVLKKENAMAVLQPRRYELLMTTRLEQARAAGLSQEFMRNIFASIHEESVAQQTGLLNNSEGVVPKSI